MNVMESDAVFRWAAIFRRCWHNWSTEKSMCGTRDGASNWERVWQEHVKSWSFQFGLSSKNLFHQERHQVSGMSHGDDFVLARPTERLTEFETKRTGVYPFVAKIISYGSSESIKALNRRLHWRK